MSEFVHITEYWIHAHCSHTQLTSQANLCLGLPCFIEMGLRPCLCHYYLLKLATKGVCEQEKEVCITAEGGKGTGVSYLAWASSFAVILGKRNFWQ